MKRCVSSWVLMGVLLVSGAALAQEEGATYSRGQGWSVLSGQTLGSGTAVTGQVGWPGLSLGLLHGATSRFDIGGKFTFNYGHEGIITSVVPGLKLQGWMRLMLLQTSRVNVGLTFAPGPFFYFYERYTEVGLTLPIALTVGIPVGSALMLNVGLDIPFYVVFGTGGGVVVPVLLGGGLEYFLDRNLAVNFNVRMGPSVGSYSGFFEDRTRARFTLEALLGIAYKF
ncbi:hypothetical protein [Archangium violaceum]|uniref:Outer membrane protein beta-barrel domain-containing protein n=1 Tax=Archangium violaceum Cb vi76 TaxID=1406225 RepID=A0A084SZT5_9BACT|nr:hypothetical protein [Archangium violaceum]KFA93970.1 hypothetical protein Q664_05920 [Archangium violaceum Cb vi76]